MIPYLCSRFSLALILSASVTACSHSPLRVHDASLGALGQTAASAPASIKQLRYGAEAEFAFCHEPACPVTTPKTKMLVLGVAPETMPLDPRKHSADGSQQVVVYFKPGDSRLTLRARKSLDAALREARAAARIVVAGRTDSAGGAQQNQALSVRRARAVQRYLTARIAPNNVHIEIDARANCCYVADNATAEGRALNRRVETIMEFNTRQAMR